jgi:NADH-quinone oxidoreductase subunit M
VLSLLFIGFGFKVPIWSFHYWLTKTHVEAPSGFSIYLSGFLVKSALFGFFKLSSLVFSDVSTLAFFVVASLGCIDASFKLWGQGDLKKIVAYCTIQEMNLILLTLVWGDSFALICGFLFSAAHAFLSALMFYTVDCVYRRYHSRSVYSVSGVYTLFPKLGAVIFFMVVVFGGLPGTLKFSCEFFIFSSLLSVSWPACVFLVFVLNFFGLVGFSKAWFNALFGLPSPSLSSPGADLSRKEASLCMFSIGFLVYVSYFFFIIF